MVPCSRLARATRLSGRCRSAVKRLCGRRSSTWWPEMLLEVPSDPQLATPVLRAALAGLQLLADGWRRQPCDRRDCDEYAPDVVAYWLTGGHWQILDAQLRSSASGIPSSGADRMALAQI